MFPFHLILFISTIEHLSNMTAITTKPLNCKVYCLFLKPQNVFFFLLLYYHKYSLNRNKCDVINFKNLTDEKQTSTAQMSRARQKASHQLKKHNIQDDSPTSIVWSIACYKYVTHSQCAPALEVSGCVFTTKQQTVERTTFHLVPCHAH